MKVCLHGTILPLNLFHNVQTTMDNEWIQLPRLLRKSSYSITALLRGTELKLEKRVIACSDDAEIVGHGEASVNDNQTKLYDQKNCPRAGSLLPL